MKKLEFNRTHADFDPHRRFTICDGRFIYTENGETAYTQRSPGDSYRGNFSGEYGCNVFTPSDGNSIALALPDGTPVPTAQVMIKGSPAFLHDQKHNMIVCVDEYLTKSHTQIPDWVRHYTVYWPNPEATPIAGKARYRPVNVFSAVEREFIRDFPLAGKMVEQLIHKDRDFMKQVSINNLPPTRQEIVNAVRDGVSPQKFLEQFRPRVLSIIRSKPLASIQRDTIKVSHFIPRKKE